VSDGSEQALVFRCEGEQLLGVLHMPASTRYRLGVLVVIGGPQYRVGSHRQFLTLARALARAGYPVLRFDYRGMGDSDGSPRTFEHVAHDIRCAIDAFEKAAPELTGIVLWGLCDAVSAILMHAAEDERVQGLILANPWVRTERGEARAYVQRYYGQRLLQRAFWRKLLSGKVDIGAAMRSFLATLWASRGSSAAASAAAEHYTEKMLRGLKSFSGPTLFLISGCDLTAAEFIALRSDDARWREALTRPGIEFAELARADHTFSQRADLDEAVRRSVEWLDEVGRLSAVMGAKQRRA
jgi:exosortase A-associated hydrolase 1